MATTATRDGEALDRPHVRAHPWLFAVAAALPVLELAVVHVAGRGAAGPLAPSVSAIGPLGVLHDLRWLFVYHENWWTFGAETAGLIAFRATLIAAFVRLAWPRELSPPDWWRASRSGVWFTLGTGLLMAPFVGMLFGAAAIPLAWLWIPGIGSAFVIALLVHRGAITGNWWRLPTWRTALWMVLSLVVLTLGGAAIALTGWWLGSLAAAATGLFNAWAWMNLVRDSVRRQSSRRVPPLAPVAAVVAIGLVVWAASTFLGSQPRSTDPAGARATLEEGGAPVLVVRGYGSSWQGSTVDLLPPPFTEVIYSYRGIGPDGDPLPYAADDTDDSLFALADLMGQQVRSLARETGGPVRIVADSEGTLITKLYLATRTDPPVSDVLLTSPLVRPAQVHYPPPGQDGWGIGSSWVLRGDMTLVTAISARKIDIDSRLARSIIDNAPVMRPLVTCPVPDVDVTILAPLTAAAVTPVELDTDIPVRWAPTTHANILSHSSTRDVILRSLRGYTPPRSTWDEVATAGRAFAAAWQVPVLPLGLPEDWWPQEPPPPLDGDVPCDTMKDLARRALDRPRTGSPSGPPAGRC